MNQSPPPVNQPRLPGLVDQDGPEVFSVLAANTDPDAISTWLAARGSQSPNTFDSYRRESTRLLLWLGENRLTLSSIKVEHVHQYFQHLADPPPHWMRPRKPMKGQVLKPTQLLIAGLSPKSISYARTVLAQMCSYLQDAGYLHRNVFKLSLRPTFAHEASVHRNLDLESWDWLWLWIIHMPQGSARTRASAIRARWLFALLYHTGLRREEVAIGHMRDFLRVDGIWKLRTTGKGNRVRLVTVNSALTEELRLYRQAMGMATPMPTPGEHWPLIVSVQPQRAARPMTARNIGKIIEEVCQAAAAYCEDEHIQAKIAAMSTHWLRHTNATHRLLAGAELTTTQDELGHKDPKTTRIYAQTADAQRVVDAEKLAALSPVRSTLTN